MRWFTVIDLRLPDSAVKIKPEHSINQLNFRRSNFTSIYPPIGALGKAIAGSTSRLNSGSWYNLFKNQYIQMRLT